MWDHLAAATNSAVAIVRNQTIASLQEAHVGTDIDQDQLEINQVSILNSKINENFESIFGNHLVILKFGTKNPGCRL